VAARPTTLYHFLDTVLAKKRVRRLAAATAVAQPHDNAVPARLAFESEICSVRSVGRRAFQDWHVKGEMNRSTSSSEIGPQGGKAQWHHSEQSSVRSDGRRAFQDWRAKGEMKRPTSSSEFLYYIRV